MLSSRWRGMTVIISISHVNAISAGIKPLFSVCAIATEHRMFVVVVVNGLVNSPLQVGLSVPEPRQFH